MDQVNKKYSQHTLRPLSMGFKRGWEMKQEHLSSIYTTPLDEVLRARAYYLLNTLN